MGAQPRTSRELQALLASESFREWADVHGRLREKVRAARVAELSVTGDPAVEMMFRAGELDEQAAKFHAEYAAVENQSLEALAAYESQRMRATQHWMVWHAAEKRVEDARADVNEVSTEIEAEKKRGGDVSRLKDRLDELEKQRDQLARLAAEAKQESDRQYAERLRLWELVEDSWHRSLRANLARSEYAYQARRCRSEAEALFAGTALEGTLSEADATAAVEEAERAYFQHLGAGRDLFKCVLIEEFVFIPIADDSKWIWCVPLIEEPDELNVQLTRFGIYQIERGRALDYIEPVAVAELESADDDDPRLDAFFGATVRVG